MWEPIKTLLRQRFETSEPNRDDPTLEKAEPQQVTPLTLPPLPPTITIMGDRASEAVDALADDLKQWFEIDLHAVLSAWERVENAPQDRFAIDELFRASHNLAGAETLYNRPHVSRLCRSLSKLAKRGKVRTDTDLMALHIHACRAISAAPVADINSDADQVCDALEAEVSKLIAA